MNTLEYDAQEMCFRNKAGERVLWCSCGPGNPIYWQWFYKTDTGSLCAYLGTFGGDEVAALAAFKKVKQDEDR